ncbi:class I SAM-dependent methyltransferase [Desulfuromonas sp. TF]|uniref:class I SAM-dependent methyltransferase n=1 Tax=Desulfuromonas sp. TF TaxID=1232410 RepID=UPI0003FB6BE1|nr:class I SAM-dependent methyltransferase [Desulfuromonas sp. TF]
MKKIYTIRNLNQQQEHMWSSGKVEDEVSACALRHIEGLFLRHLPKGEKILEAGCGLGAWVIYLGERGFDIEGVDHDARVIERLKAWRPALPVFQGDICNLPYEDASLGAYISLGVMEHFEDGCEAAMAEALRVLRPGGLMFFTVPMENPFRKVVAHPLRQAYLAWRRRQGDDIHFAEYRYTLQEVEELLASSGFEILESTWDDFLPRSMSLGLWADFPQFHGANPYRLNRPGQLLAAAMNGASRWLLSGGVFCLARKG